MLAFRPVTYFHEEQRFRDSWLWLVVLIAFVAAVSLLVAAPRPPARGLIVAIGVGAGAVLIGLAHLETTVTSDAIVVTFHGLWQTRRIALSDISKYAPMHYAIWDSGGWGIHFGFAGLTYNVSGNEGVHFRLKSGSQVLIGTQRPAELVSAIATAMAAHRPA